MFGHRKDGTKVKVMDPAIRIIPHIMSERSDSQNKYLIETKVDVFDNFIEQQRKNGYSFSYFHIIIATLIRVFKERPELNRFVMNGRTYQRDYFTVSMTVKKVLKDDGAETTVKIPFNGDENIYKVKEILDKVILEAQKPEVTSRGVDVALRFFNSLPNWLLKFLVGTIKWADKRGYLPASIVGKYGFSPFHTSIFITNLKSIKLDYLYHHLYNFGTTGLFISIGKEQLQPVVNSDTGEIEAKKVLKMGFVSDERFVDGLYYANTLKLMRKYLENPELLIENPNKYSPTKRELIQDRAYNKKVAKQNKSRGRK